MSALTEMQLNLSVTTCITVSLFCLPVSKWGNEIKAAVHPVVHYVPSVQPTFIMEVPFKLIVNVLDDGLEADVENVKTACELEYS